MELLCIQMSPSPRLFESGLSLTFIFYQQMSIATKLNICGQK